MILVFRRTDKSSLEWGVVPDRTGGEAGEWVAGEAWGVR
jgi:hypothetical protein